MGEQAVMDPATEGGKRAVLQSSHHHPDPRWSKGLARADLHRLGKASSHWSEDRSSDEGVCVLESSSPSSHCHQGSHCSKEHTGGLFNFLVLKIYFLNRREGRKSSLLHISGGKSKKRWESSFKKGGRRRCTKLVAGSRRGRLLF